MPLRFCLQRQQGVHVCLPCQVQQHQLPLIPCQQAPGVLASARLVRNSWHRVQQRCHNAKATKPRTQWLLPGLQGQLSLVAQAQPRLARQ